ncbi:hypothetical protein HHI36_009261 [Cryptolaemus montrouzieri]|uniref:Uncharacterized protein n=1 Tax=Cryptolaemus montrouzieri TaxID=559131 RepID=A0ABD2MVA8_9CUCU
MSFGEDQNRLLRLFEEAEVSSSDESGSDQVIDNVSERSFESDTEQEMDDEGQHEGTDSGDILPSTEYFEYESTDLSSLNIEYIRSMLILQPRDVNLNETVTLENAPSKESVENLGASTPEATSRIDKPHLEPVSPSIKA